MKNVAQGTAVYLGDKVIIIEIIPTTYGLVKAIVACGNEIMTVDYADLVLVTWIAA